MTVFASTLHVQKECTQMHFVHSRQNKCEDILKLIVLKQIAAYKHRGTVSSQLNVVVCKQQ